MEPWTPICRRSDRIARSTHRYREPFSKKRRQVQRLAFGIRWYTQGEFRLREIGQLHIWGREADAGLNHASRTRRDSKTTTHGGLQSGKARARRSNTIGTARRIKRCDRSRSETTRRVEKSNRNFVIRRRQPGRGRQPHHRLAQNFDLVGRRAKTHYQQNVDVALIVCQRKLIRAANSEINAHARVRLGKCAKQVWQRAVSKILRASEPGSAVRARRRQYQTRAILEDLGDSQGLLQTALDAAANDTEFGLAAYVYTKDLNRGFRVCEQIETGMIGLNRGMMSDPAAPFGGMKQSGLGREGSHHGLIEFCEAKYVAVSW